MLWAFGAGGAIGLLLGLRFRVPALLAASGLMAIVCFSVAPFTQLEPMTAAGLTFALLCMLQVGYLIGLMLSYAWSRARPWIANRPCSPTITR
jgi:hypothetical protein